MQRLLGLDWGRERIGVAISDDRPFVAVGYGVWPAEEKSFLARLASVVRDEEIGLLVVGYPLTLRGDQGPATQAVDYFIKTLEQQGYQVVRWDERYTSQDASRKLTELGISQKKQRGKLDMSAAVLILQSYIDSHYPSLEPPVVGDSPT